MQPTTNDRRFQLRGLRPAVAIVMASCALGCGGGGNEVLETPAVQHLVVAQQALDKGDNEAAIEALTASIDARPTSWAYLQRAKLLVEKGDDQAGLADCDAGLALSPEDAKDFQWVKNEAKKPKDKRFKGRFAKAPSDSK